MRARSPLQPSVRDVVHHWWRHDLGATRHGPLPASAEVLIERIEDLVDRVASEAVRAAGIAVADPKLPEIRNGKRRRRRHSREIEYQLPPGVSTSSRVPMAVLRAITCFAPNCHEEPYRRGLCIGHFTGWWRRGAEPSSRLAPGDPLPMLERLDEQGVAIHRKPACPAYSACLSWAHQRHWPGFSCKSCKGPASTGGFA